MFVNKKEQNIVEESDLNLDLTDCMVDTLKLVVEKIPYIGSLLNNVIGYVIPEQRIDRIVKFLLQLSQRINVLENKQEQWINNFNTNKNNLLLFELGCKYSSETNSDVLHDCYANVVFNAVLDKDTEQIKYEKILRTISELAEEEVIWLVRFSLVGPDFSESKFYKTFEKILEPHSRVDTASHEDKIYNAFRDQYITNLIQKGLVYRTGHREFEDESIPLLNYTAITPYGDIVVESIYNETFFYKSDKK